VFFLPRLILDSDRCVLSARLILDSDRCVLSALAYPRLGQVGSFCPCFSYIRTVVFFLPLLIL
jgi:hypothetical protein